MNEPIYFVRHGQTAWNAERRLQGQAESDLTQTGRAQARSNGETLARLIQDPGRFAFLASPLRRTRETMEIIRQTMGLPKDGYLIEPRLIEVHFGDWQGFTFPELEAARAGSTAEREADKWNFLPPGDSAESYALLQKRIAGWLEGFAGPAVVVTHGGVIRALFRLMNAMPEPEAAGMDVPQHRVLLFDGTRFAWV